MKEKIERIAKIILKNFEPARPNISSITLHASVAAAEIAKLCASEKAEVIKEWRKKRDLALVARSGTEDMLVARLAVMREALLGYVGYHDDMSGEYKISQCVCVNCERARKALDATKTGS